MAFFFFFEGFRTTDVVEEDVCMYEFVFGLFSLSFVEKSPAAFVYTSNTRNILSCWMYLLQGLWLFADCGPGRVFTLIL